MCNLYSVHPNPKLKTARDEAVAKAVTGIEYTARGGKGIVALAVQEKPVLRAMNWGITAEIHGARKELNNARSDKLSGAFWNRFWRSGRRCIIPMARFYEWTGPSGQKEKLEISGLESWLYAGGMWTDQGEMGCRYTMITTDPNPQIAPFHDRMPLLIQPDDIDQWLLSEEPPLELVCTSEQKLSIARV